MLHDGDTFTHNGREFRVSIEDDDVYEAPWDRSCGHGPVREARYDTWHVGVNSKRAGEVVLRKHRGTAWLYDLAEATRIAKRDGWSLSEKWMTELERKLGGPPTLAEIRAEAVRQDIDFLAGWLNDDWCYVGVMVELLDAEGEPVTDEYEYALWGIESFSNDYIEEVAHELADECLYERGKRWRKHLQESREARYWAERDVITEGAS